MKTMLSGPEENKFSSRFLVISTFFEGMKPDKPPTHEPQASGGGDSVINEDMVTHPFATVATILHMPPSNLSGV